MELSIKDYIYFTKEGILLPKDLTNTKNSCFYEKFRKKFLKSESKKQGSFVKVSTRSVIQSLSNISNLALEVTENCNLSCRYCIYSGNYEDQRKKSHKDMSFDIAKKAMDFFFNFIEQHSVNRTMPLGMSIGFYGGEPFLNYELIKKVVHYSNYMLKKNTFFEKNNAQLTYILTTNGTLLTEKIIDFMVKNRFKILVSIDGPEEINDRNKGNGTFKRTMDFLKILYNNYYDYYKSMVGISAVYASGTSLKDIIDFFNQEIFEMSTGIRFGNVTQFGLRNEKLKIDEGVYLPLIGKIKEKISKGRNISKIGKAVLGAFFQFKLNVLENNQDRVYAGWCTQGSKKLFVDIYGNFYGCEKVGRSFKIGNVDNGFDLEYIKRLDNQWFKSQKECENCICQAFCGACLATTGMYGKVNKDSFCKNFRKEFLNKLEEYIKFYEE